MFTPSADLGSQSNEVLICEVARSADVTREPMVEFVRRAVTASMVVAKTMQLPNREPFK